MTETDHVTRCPNCDAPREGEFCSVCGQNSRNYLRAVHRIVGEFLGETFELDSRLLITLRRLLLNPGYLSREFSAGRRARYVSPVRLYLVASVVFFFCFSVLGRGGIVIDGDAAVVSGEPEQVLERVEGHLSEDELAELSRALQQGKNDEAASDFEKALDERIAAFRANPDAAFDTFFDNLPVMMFVLLPIAAGLLKLVHAERYYSEHLVFALHVHSFLFLLFTVGLFLPPGVSAGGIGETSPAGAWGYVEDMLDVVGVVYVIAAMKSFYGQSLIRTALKALLVFVSYGALMTIGIVAVLVAAIWVA